MRGAAPAASGVGDGRIGGAFTDQGFRQNPRVDGAGPCGNMEVPPLIMWKSPWEWSYHRRSGMVANIPQRDVRH